MPTGLAIPHLNSLFRSPSSDEESTQWIVTKEQTFRWTIIDRLIGGKRNYPRP